MDKLKLAALFTAGIVTGAVPGQVLPALNAQASGTQVEVQNFKLARGTKLVIDDLSDGGHLSRQEPIWFGRACGYESNLDGGRIAEPCWEVKLDADATFDSVTAKLLDQKP